ncbi:MAG: hypothetical protein AAGA54_13240 [Myxococcota bacterium]
MGLWAPAVVLLALAAGRGPSDPWAAHAQGQRAVAVPDGPVRVALHAPLDDVDPEAVPRPWPEIVSLSMVAAAAETERAAFVVYSGATVGTLDVQFGTLATATHELPPASVRVRAVKRVPMRRQFRGTATDTVGRFAPRFEPVAMKPGQLAEIWLEVDVPAGTPAGVYVGTVDVAVGRTRISRKVRVRVRGLTLREDPSKQLGMYYRMNRRLDDPARVRRELADMRRHGIRNLVLDVRPRFGWGPGHVLAVDVQPIEQALALVAEAGFSGSVVVDAGLVQLGRFLGHDDVAYVDADGASLDDDADFAPAVQTVLEAIEQAAATHPDLSLSVLHLDEVFERGRLALFERLASVGRTPALPTYATLSTAKPAYDGLRARIDPVLDLRSYHGYSFEWWLARGGTVADFAAELSRSGDRAWFYHNERGTYFTGRWARLVNGLYLWATPFSSHVTWAYQAFDGNPLDDRDGVSHDFGMAFPDPRDPDVLMPTRIWTALGEGHDDLRHLATLQWAIGAFRDDAPALAAEAQTYLDDLRADVLRVPGGIAVEQLPRTIGTPAEAPLLQSLAARYDDAALALVRARVEEYVVALRVASGSP